jgi:hypothetical protein
VGKCGRKWPESELGVQMPCNPVTLCRNLRTRRLEKRDKAKIRLRLARIRYRLRCSLLNRVSRRLVSEAARAESAKTSSIF